MEAISILITDFKICTQFYDHLNFLHCSPSAQLQDQYLVINFAVDEGVKTSRQNLYIMNENISFHLVGVVEKVDTIIQLKFSFVDEGFEILEGGVVQLLPSLKQPGGHYLFFKKVNFKSFSNFYSPIFFYPSQFPL